MRARDQVASVERGPGEGCALACSSPAIRPVERGNGAQHLGAETGATIECPVPFEPTSADLRAIGGVDAEEDRMQLEGFQGSPLLRKVDRELGESRFYNGSGLLRAPREDEGLAERDRYVSARLGVSDGVTGLLEMLLGRGCAREPLLQAEL
jgi:hypothetical protein